MRDEPAGSPTGPDPLAAVDVLVPSEVRSLLAAAQPSELTPWGAA